MIENLFETIFEESLDGLFSLRNIFIYTILAPLLYLSYLFIKWLIDYAKRVYILNKVHGKRIIPFIGNIHQINLTDREEIINNVINLAKYSKDYPMFRFWAGVHPSVVFHKPDCLDALVSGSKNIEKSFEYSFLHPWLHTGLLNSGGEKWHYRRRLLTPTFHFEILNDFMQVMNEQAQILVSNLEAELQKNPENKIDIFKKLGLCALDIICETAMGQNVNAQNKEESKYVRSVEQICISIVERINKPYLWPDFIFYRTKEGKMFNESLKILHGFTRKVIMERHANFDPDNFKTQKRVAFLDMLLKAKDEDSSLTFDDIQEEVDTFMFEGHDTTAAAMGWACQLIASHPEVQEKLHNEIDEVFGSSNRQLKNEDLGQMKYLECAIKESLRLYPSVPLFSRYITEDQVIGGYSIPKGTTATVFVYTIHRDERYYPDPEKFDPDRFLPENSADRHPFAYIPFSAGKRNCIGQRFAMMEEKIVLANLLRRFEIKPVEETSNLKPISELILRPMNGIKLEMKHRFLNEI